jgi:hypothetical protein
MKTTVIAIDWPRSVVLSHFLMLHFLSESFR